MVKNIKKSLKYIIIIAGIIIMLPTLLYLTLQFSEVQTFIVNRVSSHFSNEINSSISVGKIEYKFFNRLSINEILIKDQNNDTLLYSQKVTAGIRNVNFKQNYIRLGKVVFIKPEVAFITDSSGLMNISWYIKLFKKSADSREKRPANLSIDQIDISDARFSLINHYSSKGKSKIDFNNLHFTSLNGTFEDIKIKNDTASFAIYNLGFKESSGFSVNRLGSSLIISKQNIVFNSTLFNCDSSIVNISKFEMKGDSSTSFKKFTEEVKLNISLEKSLLSTSDLKYFIPIVNELNIPVWLSGKVSGTVSELRGRNINFSYNDSTYLDCDFDLSGLPAIENTFIHISVNSLETNVEDIAKIIIPGKGPIVIPEAIYKLGKISFEGSFTGFTTDFVTYGKIHTNLGTIRTDISLRPEKSKRYRIQGLLTGSEINIGTLTGKPELIGKLSMNATIDGYAYTFNKFAANLTGKIDSVEINKYKYRDINLSGFFTEKTWDGNINIADDNIKMDLLGMFNFSEDLPEFNFTLNLAEAKLYELNFDRHDTTSSVSMLLTSNFRGNNIDNLDGEIKLLNSNLRKYSKNLELYDFSIKTFTDNNIPVLSLRTDFVDADIRGHYNFATIGDMIKSTLSTIMPSKFSEPEQWDESEENNFTFEINFKNTDKINNFLRTGILIAEKSYIKGEVFPDSILKIGGKSELFTIKNNVFKDFSLDANVLDSVLTIDMNSSSLTLLRQSELKDFSVDFKTKTDNFVFSFDWGNKDNGRNRGNFIANGKIINNKSENENSILTIDIDSTHIYSNNNIWTISHSTVLIDSNSINIDRLLIGNNNHYYMVNGSVSEDPTDTLHLEFNDIDINPLNLLVNRKRGNDPNIVPLDIKGRLNGKIFLTNVYKDLVLESNINVDSLSILSSEFGTLSIISALDLNKKVVNINASNNLNGVSMIDIEGYYDPSNKRVDLSGIASNLPIDALNPLLKVFASEISGLASGKVNFTGEPDKIVLKGAVMAGNASMKIDYLQTIFKINDTIRFDSRGIHFNNIKLTDEKDNNAFLSGSVYHTNFKDFKADLIINIQNPNECLVLKTKPKDNELFYGTAYASGVTTIKSGPNVVSFDISAQTGKNTKFYIPLNTGLSVSENSFITFIDTNEKESDPDLEKEKPSTSQTKRTGMDINFGLDVTPDAEVQLIFDSKVGDVIKGRGKGSLNISLNQKGDFRITGDYFIENGDYLFTLGNILNKSFSIEDGGKIMFNGDMDDAEIDIKAIYTLKASLYDILRDETFNERIPVECQLKLTGKLFNPIVGFNIYLPTADEERRTYLRNAISTEEELSRQFLYLLVMNSFYADPSYGSSPGVTTTTGTSAMAVTTTEMLSNQLSNWLSQISNDFDIGFVYRPGTGDKDINPQEVQVALSTQLLNDKVVINGNFDVRGTGSSSDNANQITGDFDAELKITNKIRLKVFNRYNNPYTGKLEPYTQGLGIFFKQDFDKFSELFRRKSKADMKKEEETTVKQD